MSGSAVCRASYSAINALTAFFESYDPATLGDSEFTTRAFVWTLIHDFGSGIIESTLNRHGGRRIRSLRELREMLWPDSISGK